MGFTAALCFEILLWWMMMMMACKSIEWSSNKNATHFRPPPTRPPTPTHTTTKTPNTRLSAQTNTVRHLCQSSQRRIGCVVASFFSPFFYIDYYLATRPKDEMRYAERMTHCLGNARGFVFDLIWFLCIIKFTTLKQHPHSIGIFDKYLCEDESGFMETAETKTLDLDVSQIDD